MEKINNIENRINNFYSLHASNNGRKRTSPIDFCINALFPSSFVKINIF